MKAGKYWIEIPDLTNNTAYEILQIVLDAYTYIRLKQEYMAETIFSALILQLMHPVRDELEYDYDWDSQQQSEALHFENIYYEKVLCELVEIAKRRVTHKIKKELPTKTTVNEMKIALLLARVLDIPYHYGKYLETKMAEYYGGT